MLKLIKFAVFFSIISQSAQAAQIVFSPSESLVAWTAITTATTVKNDQTVGFPVPKCMDCSIKVTDMRCTKAAGIAPRPTSSPVHVNCSFVHQASSKSFYSINSVKSRSLAKVMADRGVKAESRPGGITFSADEIACSRIAGELTCTALTR